MLQRLYFRKESKCPESFFYKNHINLKEDNKIQDKAENDPVVIKIYPSIFNLSNCKKTLSRDNSGSNSVQRAKNYGKQLLKQHSRLESLNFLVKHCEDIQEEGKTSRSLIKQNRKANDSINRIKRDIQCCQNISVDAVNKQKSVKNMRIDAQIMRIELGIETEKYNGKNKRIWKFVTPAITKRTEKLMKSVEKHLESRKNLRRMN
ncbi:hypothetical protein SteCoe_8543 [Stentor coeruleus]|uniref:Uncharacterized protein n=1 Tax=Stentor coeruleus TaxID=5963 RepID=A0A1R2CJY0_9CILI|nr:hypothetical protein SteCoe_8543 [Stentor coeruleus]